MSTAGSPWADRQQYYSSNVGHCIIHVRGWAKPSKDLRTFQLLSHILQATCETSQPGKHVALLTLSAPCSLTLQLIREIESFPKRRSGQGISPPDGTDPESADMIQTYCLSLPAPLQSPKNSHHKMSIKTWSLLSLCPKKAKELAKGRDLFLLTHNPGNAVSTTT